MTQKAVQLDQEIFCCSICLDLLNDPVTVACGHSYCMSCIRSFWDEEDEKKIYSCPQCRQTFTPRPALMKSTMLAALVEELKKTGLQAPPADYCYAGPGDVACDVCSEKKQKAIKSCLVCLISYCEQHLQPHYDSSAFKKHKLLDPTKNLQESICSQHNEVMKIFCCTDQQCICYLCSLDEHKGHDTVSAAAEKMEKQKELDFCRQKLQQIIQDRQKYVKFLQQVVNINLSVDKAVKGSVKEQIDSQQEAEVSQTKELEEKLEKEIAELKRRDKELEELSHMENHNEFLQNYTLLSQLSKPTGTSRISFCPLSIFENVAADMSELGDEVQDKLRKKRRNSPLTASEVDVLDSPEPKTRADFLQYLQDITLDPNTTNTQLLLSEGNRKVTVMTSQWPCCPHPDRFTDSCQVLSRQSLTGRCYWEVEWTGEGVFIAVAYKSISRAGNSKECVFGLNDKSWALYCFPKSYKFLYNDVKTPIFGCWSSRIGVYLDHSAGVLSFYSVTNTMNLLYRVQTTFTQPLHAGLWFYSIADTAEFCELK